MDLEFGLIFIGHSLFTLTSTIIHTYNVFGHYLFNVIQFLTANLGEVSSALLGTDWSLAGYELYWVLVGYALIGRLPKLDWYILH
jgi:hypothetical protein